MSTVLPTPGGDNNTWGSMLNDFLQQALVDNGSGNGNGTFITASTNPYTGGTNYNLATSTYPGLVQLAGDLTGTAASPSLAPIITAGSVGSGSAIPVITYDAKGRITAATSTSVSSNTQRTFAFFVG